MRHRLLPNHESLLHASGIADDVIEARGYRSLTRSFREDTRRTLKGCGFSGKVTGEDVRLTGLLIPIHSVVSGRVVSYQYRPDSPRKDDRGRVVKYESPNGRQPSLDVHPFDWTKVTDPTIPLAVTEGPRKVDALVSAGRAENVPLCVVGIAGVFNWRSRKASLGEWEDVALRGRTIYIVFDADARTNRNVARAMGRLGAFLRSRGAKRVVYVVAPEVDSDPKSGADDYLGNGGTLAELIAVGTSRSPVVDPGPEFTDARLAERVVDEALRDDYLYCRALGGWLRWTGVRWEQATPNAVIEVVRQTFLEWHVEAVKSRADSETQKALRGIQSRTRITAVEALARGIAEVQHEEFDDDPWLLNTPTGVVDLRTGEVSEHDPALRITRVTSVGYVPGATHPDWTAALTAVPADAREWLRLKLGRTLIGTVLDGDDLLLMKGGGENGKTTVLDACRRVLGDYAVLLHERALLGSGDHHPTEQMVLRGARLAVMEEAPEGRYLNAASVKRLVETPRMTARYIAKDSVEFDVSHSLVVTSNHWPRVSETDHGMWRRLTTLEFPYTFTRHPTEERDRLADPKLRDRLHHNRAQQEAVLAWLVSGAVEWDGPPPVPASSAAAKEAWRGSADAMHAFVTERLVLAPGFHIAAADLFEAFTDQLKETRQHEWSVQTFTARLEAHQKLRRVGEARRVRHDQAQAGSRSRYGDWSTVDGAGQYRAYLGVRFRRPEEDAQDGPVPDVPELPVAPPTPGHIGARPTDPAHPAHRE